MDSEATSMNIGSLTSIAQGYTNHFHLDLHTTREALVHCGATPEINRFKDIVYGNPIYPFPLPSSDGRNSADFEKIFSFGSTCHIKSGGESPT